MFAVVSSCVLLLIYHVYHVLSFLVLLLSTSNYDTYVSNYDSLLLALLFFLLVFFISFPPSLPFLFCSASSLSCLQ